jgi:HPt (histidine-containing phosphotransfer) domain-containing protein
MAQTSNVAGPLYSTLAGDPDLGEIIEMFVEEMPARTAALLDQFNSRDMQELRRLAHQLKGSAGSHGYAPISEVAATLEQAVAQSEPEEEIREAVDALVEICNRVRVGTPA